MGDNRFLEARTLRHELRNVVIKDISKPLVYKDGNRLGKKKSWVYLEHHYKLMQLMMNINSLYGFNSCSGESYLHKPNTHEE
jgi:hypothetical protein